jgi:hypothetical protein
MATVGTRKQEGEDSRGREGLRLTEHSTHRTRICNEGCYRVLGHASQLGPCVGLWMGKFECEQEYGGISKAGRTRESTGTAKHCSDPEQGDPTHRPLMHFVTAPSTQADVPVVQASVSLILRKLELQ